MARIAMLTSEFPPFHGGIGSYARELAAAAAAAGHDVTVLAPDYGQDFAAIDAELPFRMVRFHSDVPTMRTLPRRAVETWRLLGRERFDIIHAVDWPFYIPLRLSSGRLHGARVLLTAHGSEIVYMQAAHRRWMLNAIGFWRSGWASWIANSRYTAELLRRGLPRVRAENVRAIPLGLAESWRSASIDREVARTRFAAAADRFVIASLGRIVPRKGHGVIAAALKRVPEELARRIDWWVIGPPIDLAHANALKAATATLPIRAEWLGALPDEEVKARLSAADLFCLPGYQDNHGKVEGFGLVFLEAASLGLPSIASLSGGIPEAVEDGATGLLVPERDEAALAAAIERLIRDPNLRAQLAVAAKAKADAASWDGVMRRTYNL